MVSMYMPDFYGCVIRFGSFVRPIEPSLTKRDLRDAVG
jgi:hypothetical protein